MDMCENEKYVKSIGKDEIAHIEHEMLDKRARIAEIVEIIDQKAVVHVYKRVKKVYMSLEDG